MNILDIIANKRDKKELSDEEIRYFINGVTDGTIPDYQISALLMAIVCNGMNEKETVSLTKYMTQSGDQLDLSMFGNLTVDKHSTGGVGDKTTMIIAPIVASFGGKVAKMSGRGLGHTGGTIDKLESIPGFKTTISTDEFIKQVEQIGLSVVGQTKNLAPADKKLYALRDITATVPCIPLIASSIMSKKLAAGNHSILLDVKVGHGAFMKSIDDAKQLAKQMVNIGKSCGKNMTALITNMEAPLGNNIGNQLEVIESIDVLKGNGPDDLREICITLSSYMLSMCLGGSIEEWKFKVVESLHNESALNKFKEMISMQGGDYDALITSSNAKYSKEIIADSDGYLYSMDAETVGTSAMRLGAGRETLDDIIDPLAGIILNKKPGDHVCKGECLATLYTSDSSKFTESEALFNKAIQIKVKKPDLLPMLIDVIQ